MDDIVNCLKELKLANEKEEEEAISAERFVKLCGNITRQSILNDEDANLLLSEQLRENGLITLLIFYLNQPIVLSVGDKRVICEMIAEMAKLEMWRPHLSNGLILKPIIQSLSVDDYSTLKQTCRAIGNICFDNDAGRRVLTKFQGIQDLVNLMTFLSEPSRPLIDPISNLTIDEILSLICNCLFNVLNTYDHGHDIAITAGLVPILIKILSDSENRFSETNLSATYILQALPESVVGRLHLSRPATLAQLIDLIVVIRDEDILSTLLDVLNTLSDDDSVRMDLVTRRLCEKLAAVLNDESLSKSMAKLIAEIIKKCTYHDNSMEVLFENGAGPVYRQCLKWVNDASNQSHIINTGLSLLANFARSDANCIQIIKDSGHVMIVSVLKRELGLEGDFQLQLNSLSTLRNLALPKENKPILSQPESFDVLLGMTTVKAYPIVFKLLQTFRMLTDGQEGVATCLGTNDDFLEKVIAWSVDDEHSGVKAEASRLLTWIVKNSKNRSVVDNLVRLDGLRSVIEMISIRKKCGIMQNEAFLTLILMFASTSSMYDDRLIEGKLGAHIHLFLTSSSIDHHVSTQPEVMLNFITLMQLISNRSKKLKDHLKTHKVASALTNIPINGCPDMSSRINQVITLLNDN